MKRILVEEARRAMTIKLYLRMNNLKTLRKGIKRGNKLIEKEEESRVLM